MDLLTKGLDCGVGAVLAVRFDVREELEGLNPRLSNGIKSTVFLNEVVELSHVQFSEHPVVRGHSVDGVKKVVDTC